MNYKFESNNKEHFSLHDCLVTKAKLEDNKLTLYFPEGIFYSEYGDHWPNTSKAAVEYVVDYLDEVYVYVFKKVGKKKVVKEYNVEQLVKKINSNKWKLEFLYRYDGYKEIMHTVFVWLDKKPYSYEGQLFIGTNSEKFRWNPPLESSD